MSRLQVVEPPGQRFNYLSGNTQVLAAVLEQATGQKLADYFSAKMWAPLGAEHPALWSLDREGGTEKAYCCINSNARDFARLGQLLLDSGRWQGRALISHDYMRQAMAPAQHLDTEFGIPCDYYGFHIWSTNFRGSRVVYFRGILGQYIFAIPHLDAVVVRLGHRRSLARTHDTPLDVYTYLGAAYALVEASQNRKQDQ